MANIARWDPFDDQFPDLFPAIFGRPLTSRAADLAMRMDVAETAQDYRVSVDLPGVPKTSIEVSVDRNKVTISAQRAEEKTAGERTDWILRERGAGKLSRTLALPEAVDEARAEARHVDGVLYLTLPKQAGSMKRLEVH